MTRVPFSRGARHFTKSGLRHGPVGNPFRFAARARLPKLYALLSGFGALAFGILGYWLFFSPRFQITRISLESSISLPQDKLEEIIKEQLGQFRFKIFPQYNIFALNTHALGKRVQERFTVEQVVVTKDRPNLLKVRITEKPRSAIWVSRNQQYALDSQGVVIGLTHEPQNNKDSTLTIYDRGGGAVANNSSVLNPQHFAFLTRLVQEGRIQPLGPRFFIIERAQAAEVALKVKEGWQIHFDMNSPLEEQLGHLELTLRNTVAPDTRATLDYIDLRFGERVYVKYR